ncbi:hypothetical protein [Demetria terragena]|uniref:hypothetical protein n=1 Tax=Demetria terragena TaxID=63959 RepID=UPI000378282E|nr:hypothetical protein [Demetria terragena]
MNSNLKTFLAIFCFIWGVVGAVLAVVNLRTEPANNPVALMFAVVGCLGFVIGWLLTRRPRY